MTEIDAAHSGAAEPHVDADAVQPPERATDGPVAERYRVPLLLHSMAELAEVILPCLELADVRTVVEVGAEDGIFTRELLAWAEARDGRVWCVDPRPAPSLVELCDRSGAATLVEERSPEALEGLEHADAYLIDGDHNYYTVSRELEAIGRKSNQSGRPLLAFLNDIGWPCGRRDLYYSPESLPAEAVHPYSYERGATLGRTTLVKGGLRGEGEFAFAIEEGGPANGVLSAVEDFLESRPDLALVKVPCIFGLGVVHQTSAPYAAALARFLQPYSDSPLLERLEVNRLSLYLRILELQDDVYPQLEDCHLRLSDVATENRALWARTAELEAQVGALRGEIEHLLRSRAFSLAEGLSVLTRMRGGAGVSRQRLRGVLEAQA